MAVFYGCERSSDTLDGWTVDTQEEWVSDVLYTCTIISNLAVRLGCTYMHMYLVIICHVPKFLWVWLHSISTCPLLGTYNHSIYRYKRMRLLTKFYCMVASQGCHFTLARYEWPLLAPWGVHEGNPGILTKQYPKKTPILDISLLFSHKHWTWQNPNYIHMHLSALCLNTLGGISSIDSNRWNMVLPSASVQGTQS